MLMAKFVPNNKGIEQFMQQMQQRMSEVATRVANDLPDADQATLEQRLASEYQAAGLDLNAAAIRDVAAEIVRVRAAQG